MMENNTKENYRRRIKRKLFWDRYRNMLSILGLMMIGVMALVGAVCYRHYADSAANGAFGSGKPAEEGTGSGRVDMPEGREFTKALCLTIPEAIPAYDGEDYVTLMDSIPGFSLYDLRNVKGECFSELDALGRCGSAVAMLHRSMMPSEKRGEIGAVKPTGWVQKKYEGIIDSKPPYLYHRCHLIAYALTGQNCNERNLITGTYHFNAGTMLRFELLVMQYLEKSENHVLYRVTPLFLGEELLARGVEMEAYSVEDYGEGVCFHVFVYNVQPGIRLDYATGESEKEW